METEPQTFDFNFQVNQVIDPSFITQLGSYEDIPQQGYVLAPAYPQEQQNYAGFRPQIEQPSFNEIETINDEEEMTENLQDMYPSGFPQITPEAMAFINQHVKEEKSNHANNSTSNALMSTGHTDGASTFTGDSDDESQTTTQSKGQNENRNSPMLITKRVVRSLKTLLKGKMQRIPSHWQYLCDVLEAAGFTEGHITPFLEFLNGLKSSKKTWEGVREMLQGKGDYAKLLLNCADGLLSEEGQDDFNDWLKSRQMKEKGRKALIEYKQINRENFYVQVHPCLY